MIDRFDDPAVLKNIGVKGARHTALAVMIAYACLYWAWSGNPAAAQSKDREQTADRIVAIVDDEPISDYEVRQRMNLFRALGGPAAKKVPKKKLRERILKRLVDERLQRQEAKRLKIKVSKKQVDGTIANMAKSARQSPEQIEKKLGKTGVKYNTLREQIRTTLAWNRVIRVRFGRRVSVDKKAVKRAHEDALKKPPPSAKLAVVRQVVLPLQSASEIPSRQQEAILLLRSFKGCGSLKRITSSMFNVRLMPPRTIPFARMPPQLRAMLTKMGPGRITPPGRSRVGLEMIAYCGNKFIKAPSITEKQVENRMLSQQYNVMALRLLRDLREDAIIEYR